jgi:uncharacterized protein YggE
MKSRFALIVAVLLLTLVLSACGPAATSAPAAVQPPQRTINISGTGQVTIKPDIAYINIGVHTEDPSASNAVAQNNTNSQAVIDALKAAGVAADDLQTTNFNISPNNVTSPDGKTTSTTYMVDNTVYVKVRDLTKLGAVLDAAVKAGANNVNSIQLDLVDKTKALSDARAAAVKAAKDEATQLASAAGVTLGDIQSITYNENTPGPIMYSRAAGLGAADASVPVSAGTMDISVNVTMTYEIK